MSSIETDEEGDTVPAKRIAHAKARWVEMLGKAM